MLGSMGIATRDIPPYHVNVGIPARAVKVKEQARRDPDYSGPYEPGGPPQRKKV